MRSERWLGTSRGSMITSFHPLAGQCDRKVYPWLRFGGCREPKVSIPLRGDVIGKSARETYDKAYMEVSIPFRGDVIGKKVLLSKWSWIRSLTFPSPFGAMWSERLQNSLLWIPAVCVSIPFRGDVIGKVKQAADEKRRQEKFPSPFGAMWSERKVCKNCKRSSEKFPSPFGAMWSERQHRGVLGWHWWRGFHPLSGRCDRKAHAATPHTPRPFVSIPFRGDVIGKSSVCQTRVGMCVSIPFRGDVIGKMYTIASNGLVIAFPSPFGAMWSESGEKRKIGLIMTMFPSPFGAMWSESLKLWRSLVKLEFPSPFGAMWSERILFGLLKMNNAVSIPFRGDVIGKFLARHLGRIDKRFPSPFGAMWSESCFAEISEDSAFYCFHPLSGRCDRKEFTSRTLTGSGFQTP